jgi:rare lipoprotein A
MMLFRSSAAICGAVLALAISVTVARSEIGAVHSSAVVNEASGDAIVGAASTYNPFRPGWREGGPNTASGERYDPSIWAAAIKTSLRQKFGGVQFGARPKYALVEAVGKKVIVKINDVGPLTPGRIIDLNERAMRYFDPSLQLGVIYSVIVRPLSGDYWIPGPAGWTLHAKEVEHGPPGQGKRLDGLPALPLWGDATSGAKAPAGAICVAISSEM